MSVTASFTFEDIARAAFTTSTKADDINSEFAGPGRLALRGRNYAARLAIARSLSVAGPPPACEDSGGKTIRGTNLFGDNSRTWISLLVQHAELKDASLSDLQDLVRRHWARGAELLEEDWQACEGDYDRFLVHLAAQAGLGAGGEVPTGSGRPTHGENRAVFVPRAVPVSLPLGPLSVNAANGEPVAFRINAKGTSPHVAVMGTLGTGKTVIAKSMLVAAHKQSGCPVLLFDMGKGDLAADRSLVSELGAQVLEPPRQPIPLDMLSADAADSVALAKAALRFRESFCRIPQGSRLGDIQTALVGEAATRALQGSRPVRLADVHERLKEVYAEKRRKDDLAITTFDDMSKFKLFEPRMPPEEFFSRSWVVDVHNLPEVAQRLIVFMLLDAAYAYLTELADAPTDSDGNRAMRLVVCVDEARKVLAYEQASLIGLVRESRSKGGAVMMISQSPDDFAGDEENFLENLGIGVCLKTNAKPAILAHMLGRPEDLAGLGSGIAVTRLPDKGFVKVRAWDEQSFR